ncbi:MAG TPA: ABC transporter permease [Gemmatimonadales bacterium]|nr:ABC transporter permease [Gemmatimonadales bacterium]
MNYGELWKIAFEALRANKVKALLTMLGVVIGSACIVLVVTISLVGKRYVLAQIEAVGSNIVFGQLVRTGAQGTTLADEISLADLDAVQREIADVTRTAGTHDTQMTVVANAAERPVAVVAVTEGFQEIRNLVVVTGRYFDDDDMRSHSKVCLITEELSRAVFPDMNPVGQELRVGELRFTVIGVFKERVATFGQSEIARQSVVVPFDLLKSYSGREDVLVLYAQAARSQEVAAVTTQVEQLLRRRHRPAAVYNVENLTGILDAARNISFAVSIVLLAVGGITLVISGVGIMNIMLVTVSERTREIGLRKAVGAHQREILIQFLLEAMIISGAGAILGIAVAAAIPLIARPFLPNGITIPISGLSVIAAFLVSCITGVVFGYLPASRAAKLAPTEALRHE